MKLYYSPGACSLAPHILAHEAGIPIEIELVDNKAKKTQSGEDFWNVNPKGVVPVLKLDDGQTLTEAVAILIYLIALPFILEARREAWSATARLSAPRQPVNEMARCLTGEHLQITGDAELALELRTQGRGRDLLRNLEGTGRFEARDGRIQKFELIGSILTLLNIEDLATTAKEAAEGVTGFRYRRIAGAGRHEAGRGLHRGFGRNRPVGHQQASRACVEKPAGES